MNSIIEFFYNYLQGEANQVIKDLSKVKQYLRKIKERIYG